MDTLSLFVVISTTAIATYTDIKNRIIYRRLTLPVFLAGLLYSYIPYREYFRFVLLTKMGIYYFINVLWAWIGPAFLVFLYTLFLFWLGILDAGDGHFLISITSWCGMNYMSGIIMYFFPFAFMYLVFYLLKEYEYDWKKLVAHQLKDIIILFKCIPVVIDNIKKNEEHILVKNIPYTSSGHKRPPGMIPLSVSVLYTILK